MPESLPVELTCGGSTIAISLKKDLTRSIKRGHAWLFSDAIELPSAPDGSRARLLDRGGKVIAMGIYCRDHPLPLRVCRTEPPWVLDDDWLTGRLETAIQWRQRLFDSRTTGYRLVAGEGDGLPGLIVDRYDRAAVIKLDGGGPAAFYNPPALAAWLAQRLPLEAIVLRPRGRGAPATSLIGELPAEPVGFFENGMSLTADVVQGQKTGFFLDQRDNRALIRGLAGGLSVLNLFSFSGGFSIAAGLGGAHLVTSVDSAAPAMTAAEHHWQLNRLSPDQHQAVVADCFDYLEQARRAERQWDLVICDPPSFAPSQQTLERASRAYAKLAELAARVVQPGGLLALASCSSHVTPEQFSRANLTGLGHARRRGRLLLERGLPADHPTPLAMPETRYLKFQLLRL